MIAALNNGLLGLASGSAYALMAMALVAVHRGTGVVNFAQAGIAMFATYIFWKLFHDAGLSLPLAIVAGIGTGAIIGALFFLSLGRYIMAAPVASRILVTLGLLLVLESATRLIWTNYQIAVSPFLVSGSLFAGELFVSRLGLIMVAVAVAVAVLLNVLFNHTLYGRITAAFQDSPTGAQTMGYNPTLYGLVAWLIGGVIAATAGILLCPVSQLSPDALTSLLIPALGAAVIAGFHRFGVALAAGLAFGVIETLSIAWSLPVGFGGAIPDVLAIAAVVFAGRLLPGRGTLEVKRLFRVGNGRLRPLWIAVALCLIGSLIDAVPISWIDALTITGIYAVIGLGIVVSIGYTGQVILTPLVFVAVSMLVTAYTSSNGAPVAAALASGTLTVTVIGMMIAIPTVRVRGVGLTIGTISLAAAIEATVYIYEPLYNVPIGWKIGSHDLLGLSMDNIANPKQLCIVVWAAVVVIALAIANYRRSRAGRRLLATRADERAAAAAGVSVVQAKVAAFALSSLVCGLAGGLLAFQAGSVTKGITDSAFLQFTWANSLSVVALLVLSGVGFIWGGILSGLFAVGGVMTTALDFGPTAGDWITLVSGANLMFVTARQPDGIVGDLTEMLGAMTRRMAGLTGRSLPSARRSSAAVMGGADVSVLKPLRPAGAGQPSHRPVLQVQGLGVQYGGVRAVDDVTLDVRPATVLGILGPNGAGKSSLIDAITGFNKPISGRIVLDGADITRLPPHQRSRLGLVRTFQDNLLFEDLSVRENLQIATDPKDRFAYIAGLSGISRAQTRRDDVVAAAANLAGVTHDLDTLVEALSLGWHARVTLARVLAARPTVLCLDEPAAALSAGARADVAAVIRTAAHQLGIAVLLVEHNIDVVLDTCDEVIVMDRGRLIARGVPSEVLKRDAVRAAYLGDLGSAQSDHTPVARPVSKVDHAEP